MSNAIKAEITQIGTIDENNEPDGWIFDLKTGANGLTMLEDGSILYGGYTVDELRSIAASD